MAIPITHEIVVRPDLNAYFPFLAYCSCHWQACSRTREDALAHARNHGGRQASIGNPVSIDVSRVPPPEPIQPVETSDEQRPNGSAEAAGQEEAAKSEPTATS